MKVSICNVKTGSTSAQQAIIKLQNAVTTARMKGIRAIKVIHGWGSSGEGGVIKSEVQKWLVQNSRKYGYKDFIKGEEFNKGSVKTMKALKNYPSLAEDVDLRTNNPGITIILL